MACLTPAANLLESQGGPSKERRVKMVVSNRVSPAVQIFQVLPSFLVPSIENPDLIPEIHTKPTKVAADVPWIWVSCVQLAPQHKDLANSHLNSPRYDTAKQVLDTLVMKVATEALELC